MLAWVKLLLVAPLMLMLLMVVVRVLVLVSVAIMGMEVVPTARLGKVSALGERPRERVPAVPVRVKEPVLPLVWSVATNVSVTVPAVDGEKRIGRVQTMVWLAAQVVPPRKRKALVFEAETLTG